MDSKKWYFSKTLWFNVLALVVLVANAFGYVDFIPNENTAEYGAALITLINVILRFATKKPIAV